MGLFTNGTKFTGFDSIKFHPLKCHKLEPLPDIKYIPPICNRYKEQF